MNADRTLGVLIDDAARNTASVEIGGARWDEFLSFGAAILPYEPPTQPPVADPRAEMQMTFAQLLIGLVAMGWITKPEGIAWLGGTVPVAVNTLIASLPVDQQFAALARAVRPSVVQRLDALVVALAAMQGRTDAQMDTFFVTYAAV